MHACYGSGPSRREKGAETVPEKEDNGLGKHNIGAEMAETGCWHFIEVENTGERG